jgi:hypothetical protein
MHYKNIDLKKLYSLLLGAVDGIGMEIGIFVDDPIGARVPLQTTKEYVAGMGIANSIIKDLKTGSAPGLTVGDVIDAIAADGAVVDVEED